MTGKKIAMLLGALGIGTAALAWGHSFWETHRFLESTDDAYVGGDITVIAPHVAGFITDVVVQDNQAVHAGDLLVRIDDRDFKAQLARADAVVAARRAQLASLDASRALQQPVIGQAQAEVASVNAEIQRTKLDVERYRVLSADHSSTVQRLEVAEADFHKAEAAVDKAHASHEAAQRQLHVIDTQKQAAQAALAQAIADRELAQLDVEHTELRAPIDGVVGNRSARKGAYATPGAALVSIVPARGLWVDANFKESQLTHMQPGQRVEVVADIMPGRRFVGHVSSLAPATGSEFSVLPAQNATGNFTKIVQRVPVRVVLDGDAGLLGALRPGLSVTAEVDTQSSHEAIAAR